MSVLLDDELLPEDIGDYSLDGIDSLLDSFEESQGAEMLCFKV